MASNFLKDAGDRIADFVDWAKEQLADEAIRKSIAEDLGLGHRQQRLPAYVLRQRRDVAVVDKVNLVHIAVAEGSGQIA